MRFVHASFALLFVLGALVQLNDPDPVGWVAIYLAAAAIAVWRRLGLCLLVGGIALLWAVNIGEAGLGPFDAEALFGDSAMKTEAVERWREVLGLLIITAYALASAAGLRAGRLH
ncbi:MAG: hypothetical protein ACI8RZ_002181 [Myxococcota bacterium]|jgi:hypothetical protein